MNILAKLKNLYTGLVSKSPLTDQQLNKQLSQEILTCAHMSVQELLKILQTSEHGLPQAEAKKRLKESGLNEIAHEKATTWYALLFRNFKNPFNILLISLGIISFFIGENDAVIIISVMVLLSVVMRFIQEFRSNKAAEKLKALVSTKATVLRLSPHDEESKSHEINIKFLVPGDIIHLSAGDMIPADVRLISAKELFVSQASLTGESMPVEKR